MNYVRGFAPWLCYAALSPLDWRLGMCAAALVAVLSLVARLRAGGVDLLGAATCAFFVAMAAISLAAPDSGLNTWTCSLANAVLAVTALASLVVRRPFTLSIARSQVPQEFWNAPRFIRVNMVLTGAWTTAFAAAAAACALVVRYDHAAALPLITVQVLAFVIPFAFSGWYASRAQAKAAAAAAEHTTA
ncbi:hypothetical protein [Kitasatospora sp. NPDC056531]|uniref:hypothetical protein n=1 Tax=Kitasatospora sp. NPDC056531 TaxID=3345856 RepID=UPI00367CA843